MLPLHQLPIWGYIPWTTRDLPHNVQPLCLFTLAIDRVLSRIGLTTPITYLRYLPTVTCYALCNSRRYASVLVGKKGLEPLKPWFLAKYVCQFHHNPILRREPPFSCSIRSHQNGNSKCDQVDTIKYPYKYISPATMGNGDADGDRTRDLQRDRLAF